MSNLLYMDESNGNGVYATILNINSTNTNNTTAAATANMAGTTTAAAATATTTNNLNSIMNATATTANVAASTVGTSLPTSASNEDLSQSLSEYTDADESISAPTEFLAEFLSAVMLKDYKKALKYCKLILQYEPNNSTAKEFYPLILDKLRGAASSDSDENYNKSSSPELILELQGSDPSAGESDEAGSDEPQLGMSVDYTADDYGVPDDNYSGGTQSHDSHSSSNNCSEGLSLSESVESENDDDDEDGDVEEEEEDVMSSSGDDLPVDEPEQDNAPVDHNVSNLDNSGSHSSRNSSSGGGGRSRSDNTTHSYSSLLLEEEDDMVPASLQYSRNVYAADLDVSNGNKLPSASCSDSESPTEPLTQRLAAILRSKCGVSSTPDGDY